MRVNWRSQIVTSNLPDESKPDIACPPGDHRRTTANMEQKVFHIKLPALLVTCRDNG